MLIPTPSQGASLVLALVAGLAVDAGFPGLGWWPVTFVGIGLLFLAMARDSARWNALVGFVFGLAFFLPHIIWAREAVGTVPWAALSVVEAAFVAVLGAGWTWARRIPPVRRRAGLQVLVLAVLWVGMEEARSSVPFGGFPWGRLAFSQADSPLGRWAWGGGAPLVSGLVVVTGVLVALAVLALCRAEVRAAGLVAVLAAAVVASGAVLPLPSGAENGTLRVAAVQGNVPNRGLNSFDQQREVLDNHVAGTLAVADTREPIDLVLWPENGSDIDPRADRPAAEAVTRAARAVGAPVLVGTIEYPPSGGRLNVSLLWDPERGPLDAYAKQHPAPFAEYVPFRRVARMFSDAVDLVRNDMLPGTEVGLVDVPVDRLGRSVGVGDVICFEVAYDGLVREAVRAGGEVLVVQTNNATFGLTDESTQQLAMSRLRAMEHGRATVQISTVGVSGVISPSGEVLQQTGLFTAEQLLAGLPLRSTLTPATRFGDALAWSLGALAVALVVAGLVTAARRRSDGGGDTVRGASAATPRGPRTARDGRAGDVPRPDRPVPAHPPVRAGGGERPATDLPSGVPLPVAESAAEGVPLPVAEPAAGDAVDTVRASPR